VLREAADQSIGTTTLQFDYRTWGPDRAERGDGTADGGVH
jgi:hypothetical protein